jgi:hypothetical protein
MENEESGIEWTVGKAKFKIKKSKKIHLSIITRAIALFHHCHALKGVAMMESPWGTCTVQSILNHKY